MPYKHTLPEVLMMLFTDPPEAFRIIGIMIAGGITRACLGEDSTFKKRSGDIVFCILIFYSIKPFIPVMPTFLGVQVPRGTIAIAISLLGSHVIYTTIKFGLKFFLKKKTGIDLKETKNDG